MMTDILGNKDNIHYPVIIDHLLNQGSKPRTRYHQPKCGNCHMKGHRSRDCRKKEFSCYRCKRPGHYSNECKEDREKGNKDFDKRPNHSKSEHKDKGNDYKRAKKEKHYKEENESKTAQAHMIKVQRDTPYSQFQDMAINDPTPISSGPGDT